MTTNQPTAPAPAPAAPCEPSLDELTELIAIACANVRGGNSWRPVIRTILEESRWSPAGTRERELAEANRELVEENHALTTNINRLSAKIDATEGALADAATVPAGGDLAESVRMLTRERDEMNQRLEAAGVPIGSEGIDALDCQLSDEEAAHANTRRQLATVSHERDAAVERNEQLDGALWQLAFQWRKDDFNGQNFATKRDAAEQIERLLTPTPPTAQLIFTNASTERGDIGGVLSEPPAQPTDDARRAAAAARVSDEQLAALEGASQSQQETSK